MDKWYKWKVLLIVAAVAFSIWRAYPPQEKINLGLDLIGGMQMLLKVDLSKVPAENQDDASERVTEIIRNRIDEFGVREPVISKQGREHVVVQLPGVTDRQRAIDIVSRTAHLEFKLVSEDSALTKKAEEGQPVDGYDYVEYKGPMGISKILLQKEAALTGDHLTSASVGFDQYGTAIVQLQFDKEGAKKFDQVTFQNVGKQLAIVLDGKVHSAPVIRDRIPNGQAQISGNFSASEASDLALVLRAGALPAPVEIIEERTVGASLGKDSIEKSLKAGLFGTAFVFVFILGYYLLSGLIAGIGLLVYITILVGSLAALGATWTLPGIAGFILSIGMAVDANVLIFERMREEKATGKMARAVVSAGYHKAFSSILDSNLTTLLTSLLLFIFGTGPVKGFAVTLSAGIVASMFSALVVTRVIFDFLTRQNPKLNLNMFQWIKPTKINFLKGRFWAYGFSVLTIAIGIFTFFVRGNSNYGVEFTGGTMIHLSFSQPMDAGKLRDSLEKNQVKASSIQRYGELTENQFIIKIAETDSNKIKSIVDKVSSENPATIMKVDQVGPTVSGQLTEKALWAVLWSALGILVYLAWRFEWKFALAAVVALFHDTLFAFGVYSLSGREITLPIVAAILTIMGFSVNDTIVTFDRVRDNVKTMKKTSFSEIVNVSVNQTLSRTLLTSLTTMISTLCLFVFGGGDIKDFAFVLLIGFGVGVYSTIFVASSLVVDWKAHR